MPWLSSPVVNGVCLVGGTAGGTAGCEFNSPCWQLFFMGLDWILSDQRIGLIILILIGNSLD